MFQTFTFVLWTFNFLKLQLYAITKMSVVCIALHKSFDSSLLVLLKMTLFVDCTVTGAKTAKGHCTVTFLSIIGLVTKCYCTCNGSQTKHFVLKWRSFFLFDLLYWLFSSTASYARHLIVFCCDAIADAIVSTTEHFAKNHATFLCRFCAQAFQ